MIDVIKDLDPRNEVDELVPDDQISESTPNKEDLMFGINKKIVIIMFALFIAIVFVLGSINGKK
jgi:hypothetical protein